MKILSWNILADEFVSKEYYPTIPFKLLDREKRLKSIINKIIKEKPDVLLLQEVMIKEYTILKEIFTNNFFISDLFIVKWKYNNEYDKQSESGNVILLIKNKFNDPEILHDDLCIVSCIYKNKRICFINIHLDDLSSNTRYNQLTRIIDKTNNFSHIIISGDFNQKYDINSDLYKLIKNNYFYPAFFYKENTNYNQSIDSIDNLFYKGFKLLGSSISNDCGNRTIDHITCQITEYGSDHFPIIIYLDI